MMRERRSVQVRAEGLAKQLVDERLRAQQRLRAKVLNEANLRVANLELQSQLQAQQEEGLRLEGTLAAERKTWGEQFFHSRLALMDQNKALEVQTEALAVQTQALDVQARKHEAALRHEVAAHEVISQDEAVERRWAEQAKHLPDAASTCALFLSGPLLARALAEAAWPGAAVSVALAALSLCDIRPTARRQLMSYVN